MDTENSLDLNNDGVQDGVALDTNSDGSLDYVVAVDSATGISDTYLDTDADGVLDTDIMDVSGDGIPDLVLSDTDGDGQFDAQTILTPDLEQQPQEIDEPTQNPSQSVVQTDPTADPDAQDPFPSQPGLDPNLVADPLVEDPATQPSTNTYTTSDRLAWEGQFWQQQTENGFCAPTSVAILISELTGQNLDASQFVQRAIDLGLLTEGGQFDGWSGMTVTQTEQLVESFGIPAEVFTPASAEEAWSSMQGLIDQNYGIVAFIDSSEVWERADDPATDTTPMDHAVTIAAYDDNYVYLNDPGIDGGKLEAVPREQFEQAWSDSGYAMVVPDMQGPTSTVAAETGVGAEPGVSFTGQMPNYFEAEQQFLADVVTEQAGIAILAVVIPAAAITVIARTAIQEAHKK
jgi:predicted double-glycine peptidase